MMEEANIAPDLASVDTDDAPSVKCHPKRAEAADYYMENGFVVFTEAYHLRRGHCCRSGCRHCPYGFKHKR